MGTWFWVNISLALLFVCCWAGIPLWHTFRRWDAELREQHAEVAARAVAQPVLAQPVPATAAAEEVGSPAYAGVADLRGR